MATKKEIKEFLKQSNFIEDERTEIAHADAQKAWDYAYKHEGVWDVNFILKIHRLLMKRIRPDIAGKLRDCDVWIGGQKKAFISESLLKSSLKEWIEFMESLCRNASLDEVSRIAWAKDFHIKFENIHPFEDGNGRTGRILYNVHRLKLGLPLHIIHEGHEQMEYYTWFRS